jgi:hypothetical protein
MTNATRRVINDALSDLAHAIRTGDTTRLTDTHERLQELLADTTNQGDQSCTN